MAIGSRERVQKGVLAADLVPPAVGFAPALVFAGQPASPAGLREYRHDLGPGDMEVGEIVVDLEELGLDKVDVIDDFRQVRGRDG